MGFITPRAGIWGISWNYVDHATFQQGTDFQSFLPFGSKEAESCVFFFYSQSGTTGWTPYQYCGSGLEYLHTQHPIPAVSFSLPWDLWECLCFQDGPNGPAFCPTSPGSTGPSVLGIPTGQHHHYCLVGCQDPMSYKEENPIIKD